MKNKSFNKACPISGRPVVDDSLTTYRGYVVGFCNPGCRDAFEIPRVTFDKLIDEQAELHEKRFVDAIEVAEISGARVKSYIITEKSRNRPNLSDGYKFACTHLATEAAYGIAEKGLGYLILHAGEDADWLLVRWWLPGGIVAGIVASRQGDAEFKLCERPYVECVWEGIITEFERSAWVQHMMCATPDQASYLDATLPAGAY